ncbi:MAG: glutamate racemase [Cyanobacteria bacterium M_surface_10_m2_179]|nr:glutamate racemase [Cyanobacteria bacterium M_surface_10_m2_179]
MSGASIGIFDSGVGGLSVWRQVVHHLPHERLIYLADQAHVPYGQRSASEIQAFCHTIAEQLLALECKAIVVACNTASAVALEPLRRALPGVPILGLEPAVKPAVSLTRSGVVGVMATPATFQGELYRATVGRWAGDVQVVEQVCIGLADLVEQGELEGKRCDASLRQFLEPMLAAGADTIVLGCTHYPFVIETIRRLVGPSLAVLDPAPAVARHLGAVLEARGLLQVGGEPPQHAFFTTGDPQAFDRALARLVGATCRSLPLAWCNGRLEAR